MFLNNKRISQIHPWKNIIHCSVEAGDKNETIEVEVKEGDNNDPSINEEKIGILLDEVVKENYWDYFKTHVLNPFLCAEDFNWRHTRKLAVR